MRTDAHTYEALEVRRPFEAWSIAIPAAFDETFIQDGQYWHARDASRSVSLTSLTVFDGARPVSPRELLERLPPIDGVPVIDLPGRLQGSAAEIVVELPAIASHAISAVLVTLGRVLMVTITSDDLAWAHAVFATIRTHPTPARPQGGPTSRGVYRPSAS